MAGDGCKAMKRVAKELKALNKSDGCPEGVIGAGPRGDNLLEWQASIEGPEGTPYEDGIFFLNVKFPTDYPFKPPEVTFETTIYHPNVNTSSGAICMDTLKQDQWGPSTTLAQVLSGLLQLLAQPNPDDPLQADIAALYKSDIDAYNAQAAAMTEQHATG